jgi:Ca2+:H+ antiporter
VTPRGFVVAIAVLVPASVVADVSHNQTLTFVLSALAVVPLAGLLGHATEQLALHTGPQVGSLLNATFGNAAELIIGLLLVFKGELDVVRASITGSIIGNLLLVLGASFFAAGLRRKDVRFSAQAASTLVASMALAVGAILMPTIYANAAGVRATDFRRESISIAVGIVLVGLYAANLLFSLVTHTDTFRSEPYEDEGPPAWSPRLALGALAAAGILVAFESELLVGALGPTVQAWGVSKIWVGLILVPIVGNAAEHSTAVLLALKGKTDIAIGIAVGSSAQIALLVGPLLVFAGALSGNHFQLVVTPFELAAIAISVAVVALLVQDGRTNWLEGVQLLGLYGILAVASFYLGQP